MGGSETARFPTHFSRNVLARASKRHQPGLGQCQRQICNAMTAEDARRFLKETVEEYGPLAPAAVAVLEDGFDDATTIISLPLKYRRKLRTSNGLERLNEGIRRRNQVIRI